MKHSKAVYVTIQDIKSNLNRENKVYLNKVVKPEQLETNYESNKDFSCQYDSKKDTVICTCKRGKRRESTYFRTARQVYTSQRYSRARDFTDVGVGCVKTLPKKRVRRILLPDTDDRAVGSSDLTSFISKTRNWARSYYDQKKTSSKCVGSAIEYKNISVFSKKLSPIYQTKSISTSPRQASFEENKNIEKLNILHDQTIDLNKRKGQNTILIHESPIYATQTDKINKKLFPITTRIAVTHDQDFSSDSLVQHIHDLENSSSYKQSKTSIDLIENKLEKEYRKIFTTRPKESKPTAEIKPIQGLKSASILRRRFEALRRGVSKKESFKNDCVVTKTPSQASVTSKKDVSIASDPPSLESKSYTNIQTYSPISSSLHKHKIIPETSYKRSATIKKDSSNWSSDVVDNNKSVEGMFKLWGKKFNLEDDCYKKSTPNNSLHATKKPTKKVELVLPKEVIEKEKKERKRFLFFKRKAKDKSKEPYKSKKGVTAGRCEVGDGLMIKIGAANDYSTEVTANKSKQIPDAYDDMLRNAWLKRYLTNKIDSRNSVQIRWNNDMYATSSSTVFELMECVYKNMGIVFRSKSDVTTRESSNYHHAHMAPQVNYMQQSIEAWMVPKVIADNKEKSINIVNPKKEKKKNIEVSFSNRKWLIDNSKAFSQNIEIVLRSENVAKNKKVKSSDYVIIDIPKGYFSETSSDNEVPHQTSDEQVYNIVEYETGNSNPYLKKRKDDRKMDIGDHETHDVHVILSLKNVDANESKIVDTLIKKPPLRRDVVVQGSNVYLPKRCDVVGIGVGIITQRDLRAIQKPILKMRDEITDDESIHIILPRKKCELAESYLQEYYRHCTPLGVDVFSWCVSDSRLRSSSDNYSLNSLNNQGDGSKSCPNIHDEYQASTIVSPCATSSCSYCMAADEEKKTDESKAANFFSKFRKKPNEPAVPSSDGKRVLPKDSLEVFKRRKIYAASNKSNWGVNDDKAEPYSVPSIADKGAQNTLVECPKDVKPRYKDELKPKKRYKKHVSLQDCDVMNEVLKQQLSDKLVEGILSYKGSTTNKTKELECSKHAQIIPDSVDEMLQPPCIESCIKTRIPPCAKKNSSTCLVPAPPPCPVGPPSPCQSKACPPSPPPCAMIPPCLKSPPDSPIYTPPRTPILSPSQSLHLKTPVSRSPPPCSCPKSINQSPREYSPRQLPAKRPPKLCACTKKKSPCDLPQCPSVKSSSCTQKHRAPCISSDEKLKKCSSHDFPWPLKNRQPKTPSSKNSGMSLKKSVTECLSQNKFTAALKRLVQKLSNSSVKEKDCKPDCANRHKMSYPPPPPSTAKTIPPSDTRNQPKTMGVHLKKLPMPQNLTKDSESLCDEDVIRINSKEKIIIKMKQQTPSTEEIREGCNIKVQDEDGQTLYERVNYKKADRHRANLVKDMYRDSQIQRVSTSNTEMILDEKNSESYVSKSITSLSNIIEINLNLKFKQGDKSTEVNIKNCGDTQEKLQNENVSTKNEPSKEVYILDDKAKEQIEGIEDGNKKDVNIKIVIKSCQQNPNKSKRLTKNSIKSDVKDEFSRKISEKFHTVSTGYSDVLEPQTFSVHTTTINITDSSDKSKLLINPSKELVNEELIEQNAINLLQDESITKRSVVECSISSVAVNDTENEYQQSDTSQIKLSKNNLENTVEICDATGLSTPDNNEDLLSDVQHSIPKIRNKEEKKKILKQIFEDSNETKNKTNKSKMRMLRAVLTSDSSGYEDAVVNNELAKELTYASLKPNFFKDSDSMKNYYQLGSLISDKKPSRTVYDEILYPTEQSNSEFSNNETLGCLCNQLAAKLNIHENVKACSCRDVDKIDKNVGSNLTTDNKNDYVDVETQNSKYSESNHKKSFVTIESTTVRRKKPCKDSNRLPKKFSYSTSIKTCPMRNINRQTILGLSDDDKVFVINSDSKSQCEINERDRKLISPIDIFQLHETKKAVLEIYAERIVTDKEHMVARLPKYKESLIRNYQEIANGFRHISKRNIVMMSTTR